MVSLIHKPKWVTPMLVQDTNALLPAVHLPRETIELAQDLQRALDAIQAQQGEGQITLKVCQGKIPFIDWTFRTFRKLTKR